MSISKKDEIKEVPVKQRPTAGVISKARLFLGREKDKAMLHWASKNPEPRRLSYPPVKQRTRDVIASRPDRWSIYYDMATELEVHIFSGCYSFKELKEVVLKYIRLGFSDLEPDESAIIEAVFVIPGIREDKIPTASHAKILAYELSSALNKVCRSGAVYPPQQVQEYPWDWHAEVERYRKAKAELSNALGNMSAKLLNRAAYGTLTKQEFLTSVLGFESAVMAEVEKEGHKFKPSAKTPGLSA